MKKRWVGAEGQSLFKVWVTRHGSGSGCVVHARKVVGYPVKSPRGAIGFSVQSARSAVAAKQKSGFTKPQHQPAACRREGVLGGARRKRRR
jgi:hypothetical protein